jgi:hypothetical protein
LIQGDFRVQTFKYKATIGILCLKTNAVKREN